MKNLIIAISILLVLFACSKDDTTVDFTTPENPVKELVDAGYFDDIEFFTNQPAKTYGYSFTPKVDGSITEIGTFIPTNNNTVVCLWDATTKMEIFSFTIAGIPNTRRQTLLVPSAANQFLAGKEYVISIFTPAYFTYDASFAVTPYSGRLVDIGKAAQGFSGNGNEFPTFDNIAYEIAGLIDFTFQPN